MIEKFTKWLRKQRTYNMARRMAVLKTQADEAIQVREYAGKLYFSYRDTPLMPLADVKRDYIEELEVMRGTYIEYQKNKQK